jgi:cytochrome bd ubiquinol oxidase subunit II
MTHTLPILFGLAMTFGIAMYVVSDGFDLGVGILFLLAPTEHDRDVMMSSVAPIWDGNETWLVFGGTVLFAAFPVAYATVLPAFYLPLVLMLFGLIFRGVAFEYRFRARAGRRLWDWTFSTGSSFAAFTQGLVLGGYINGIAVQNEVFAGTSHGILTPFALVCGLGLLAGYALLGATWLVFKTAGSTRDFGRMAAIPSLALSALFLLAISIWTPLDHRYVALRWFSPPAIHYIWIPPLLTALVLYGIWRALHRAHDAMPFVLSVVFFLLALLGLSISLWPYAVPYSVTLWQAASSTSTLIFLGIGTAVILPIIVLYLAYAHWVFRGKASGGGYGSNA